MADDKRDRPAGMPQGRHHPNQDKYDQNVFGSENAGNEHGENLLWRIPFF